jgi:hypothetical protein
MGSWRGEQIANFTDTLPGLWGEASFLWAGNPRREALVFTVC